MWIQPRLQVRPFYPEVFKAVAQEHPDVLLIPENESMTYFAYSAPLNSYVHHKITSTPTGARLVYPNAFSVLMAADGDRPEDHAALLNAVRRGDILLFNGWYNNDGAGKVKRLYEEAGFVSDEAVSSLPLRNEAKTGDHSQVPRVASPLTPQFSRR